MLSRMSEVSLQFCDKIHRKILLPYENYQILCRPVEKEEVFYQNMMALQSKANLLSFQEKQSQKLHVIHGKF